MIDQALQECNNVHFLEHIIVLLACYSCWALDCRIERRRGFGGTLTLLRVCSIALSWNDT